MIKRISELENFSVWQQLREQAIGKPSIVETGADIFKRNFDLIITTKFSTMSEAVKDNLNEFFAKFINVENLSNFLDSCYGGSSSLKVMWNPAKLSYVYGRLDAKGNIIESIPTDSIKRQLDIINIAFGNARKSTAEQIPWAPLATSDDLYDPEIRGIQKQIVWNIDDLLSGDSNGIIDDIYFWGGRRWHPDTLTWQDIEDYPNTDYGRYKQTNVVGGKFPEPFSLTDPESKISSSNQESIQNTPVSSDQITTHLPILNSNKAYIEVSELAGDGAEHSNFVSRKVPLIWFYNVIKALQGLKNKFGRLVVGHQLTEVQCACSLGEINADAIQEETPHGDHHFNRATKPASDGRMIIYGNAELNGEVTTFHSETRFHDRMYIWDTMNVYGNSYFSNDINGTAMRCRWADLAEYYEADDDYTPGTLVRFGGDKEITIADELNPPNAIVTNKPGLTLNSPKEKDDKKMVGVVLTGRSPIRVIGKVKKFDKLYLSRIPGVAVSAKNGTGTPIAIALESNDSENEKLVEAVSKLTF